MFVLSRELNLLLYIFNILSDIRFFPTKFNSRLKMFTCKSIYKHKGRTGTIE